MQQWSIPLPWSATPEHLQVHWRSWMHNSTYENSSLSTYGTYEWLRSSATLNPKLMMKGVSKNAPSVGQGRDTPKPSTTVACRSRSFPMQKRLLLSQETSSQYDCRRKSTHEQKLPSLINSLFVRSSCEHEIQTVTYTFNAWGTRIQCELNSTILSEFKVLTEGLQEPGPPSS